MLGESQDSADPRNPIPHLVVLIFLFRLEAGQRACGSLWSLWFPFRSWAILESEVKNELV